MIEIRVETAMIRLLQPEGYTPDGLMFVDAQDLLWHAIQVKPADVCEHQWTMCSDCVESWKQDHEVIVDADLVA